jgi:hypothetical protein
MEHFTSGFLQKIISIPSLSSNMRNFAFTNTLPLSVSTTNGLLPLFLGKMDRKAEATVSSVLEWIGIEVAYVEKASIAFRRYIYPSLFEARELMSARSNSHKSPTLFTV